MKRKHFALIVFFLFFICTLAGAQTRRIEEKKKGQEDSTDVGSGMSNPEVVFNVGHSASIESIAYSPDGAYIASGSEDNTIKLWEVETGRLLRTLRGHNRDVNSICYSPDGKYIASGSNDNRIKLWEVKTGECVKTLGGFIGYVNSVCYSPDGKYIASGSNTIKLWDVKSGECIKTLSGHNDDVNSVCYSPDGKYIASGSDDETIKLWDVARGECIKTLSGHTWIVHYVCYSPDGKYMASGSYDSTIKLWDVATGERIKTLRGHTSWVKSVCYSPDGKYVASGSDDNTIKLWEVKSGECIKTLRGHNDDVNSVCYSPDGKYIASGSDDDTTKLWEVKTGECVKTLGGYIGYVNSVCYSPDGKYVASGSRDGTIKLWDVKSGERVKTLSGHTNNLNSVCYSPDGKYLVSGSRDGTIRFWNASTGDLLATTFNLKDGEWLTYTSEGFFAGSEWASKNLVHIVDGMKTVGIDQMYDFLYRPDLVSAKLRGEDISIHAQRVDIASFVRTGSAPITTFLSLDETITNRDVIIEFAIENTGGGIGEVNLLLNGKNIRLAEKVASKTGETVHFSHTITLQNGENTLELYAKNGAGKVESLRARKTLKWNGNTKKPNLYVLTVAINQYRDRELRLKYAVPDAQLITKGFSKQKKALYQNIFNFNLFDGDVTKEGIKSIFQELSNKVQADDVFIFYLAGHGVTYDEDGDYYYLPSDFRYRNAQDIQKQGISKNDLTRFLSLIKAGKTLILMDTCNAGSFLGMNTRGGLSSKDGINQVIDRLTRTTGHATIVASSDNQVAMEGYEGHGIFTYILVEGLSGKADADGDGYITLQELSSYTDREVPTRSFEKWGYEQIPQRVLFKQDFPIYMR